MQVQPSLRCASNQIGAAKNSFVTSCVAFPDSKSHSPRHIYTWALGVWFHSWTLPMIFGCDLFFDAMQPYNVRDARCSVRSLWAGSRRYRPWQWFVSLHTRWDRCRKTLATPLCPCDPWPSRTCVGVGVYVIVSIDIILQHSIEYSRTIDRCYTRTPTTYVSHIISM